MYAVLANGGRIDGKQFLSQELTQGLVGKPRVVPDLNVMMPMPVHLGYHESPIPGLLKGFGHIGLGGTLGWADPDSGSSFAYVHNGLLTPMVLDMASFAGLARPLRSVIAAARHRGPLLGTRPADHDTEEAGSRAALSGIASITSVEPGFGYLACILQESRRSGVCGQQYAGEGAGEPAQVTVTSEQLTKGDQMKALKAIAAAAAHLAWQPVGAR